MEKDIEIAAFRRFVARHSACVWIISRKAHVRRRMTAFGEDETTSGTRINRVER